MKFTKRSSFKRLAQFVLCLVLCVALGATSFAPVAFGGQEVTTTVGNEDLTTTPDSSNPYSSIITQNAPCAFFNEPAKVYFNLAPGCVMQVNGDQNDGDYVNAAIKFYTTDASKTVTVTNSAKITMNLTNDKPSAIYTEGIMRFMGDITLTINGGNDGGAGILLNKGSSIFEAGLKITMKPNSYQSAVTTTSEEGFVAGKFVAGFSDFDAETPSTPNGKTVQIKGDIYASSDSAQNFVALANSESYLEGYFGNSGTGTNMLYLANGGTWYPAFYNNSSNNVVDIQLEAGGIINMNDKNWDGAPRPFRTLNINTNSFTANGGGFVINTDLAANAGDKININGSNKSGTGFFVQVAYDPTAILGQKVTATGDGYTFTNGIPGLTLEAKEYIYDKQGKTVKLTPEIDTDSEGKWSIKSVTGEIMGASETTKAVSDTAQTIGLAWLNSINNLQKRLGDLRGGEESNMGWVRFARNLDDLNNGRKVNVSGNLYQIGYDFALKNDKQSRGYFGLSLERYDGNQSYEIGGGDVKSTTLGAYYTKIYESGHYFDFIFRYGRYESDSTSCDTTLTTPELTKLDYAMNGVTLSGEYGYRANIGKNGLYLEPQAEFIYGYLGGVKKTSSTGVLADIDSTNHFVSRLGLAFGQRVKNLNYYLRTSYYHDFAGSTNITYGDASYKQDGAQNWWEVSLGGGWNVSNNSYIYAELTKHFKDVSNSLNFNLGFRFTL